MLIAISNYLKPLAELDTFRPAHHEYIKQFIDNEKLLVCGRQNPPVGGVIIAKNASRKEFEEILSNDPFAKKKVAEYKIIEFDPSFYANEFQSILNR